MRDWFLTHLDLIEIILDLSGIAEFMVTEFMLHHIVTSDIWNISMFTLVHYKWTVGTVNNQFHNIGNDSLIFICISWATCGSDFIDKLCEATDRGVFHHLKQFINDKSFWQVPSEKIWS